jgi:hypothetical protein
MMRGLRYGGSWRTVSAPADRHSTSSANNPMKLYFDSHLQGRGIWKWEHYFDVYQRHFQKYVGRDVHILEIGVYSGGSLEMWRSYLGDKCQIHGVDLESACKVYENGYTRIDIGDQSDRLFWRRFRELNPVIDIVVDDGSHMPNHQIAALEEMLPHLQPGGVYLVEDVQGERTGFSAYVHGLAVKLNAFDEVGNVDPNISAVCRPAGLQAEVDSVHLYPYVAVIEKRASPATEFVCRTRGTEWQPFLEFKA